MVQYSIAMLGGPLVTHINVVVLFGCAKPHSIGGVIRITSGPCHMYRRLMF